MIVLLLACRRAPLAAAAWAPDPSVLRPTTGPPLAWDLVFERELGDLDLWQEGGRAWAHRLSQGSVEEILALADDGSVRWRHPLRDAAFLRLADDGRSLVITDLLGCFAWHDADTGERIAGHTSVLDPFAWDLSADGADVWTWDLEGRLIARRRGVEAPVARIDVSDDEAGADLEVAGAVAYLSAEGALVARSLPDGAVLGRRRSGGGGLCRIEPDRVWILPDDGDEARAVPLDPRTLATLGPPSEDGCGRSPLSWDMYGLTLRHPDGSRSALGHDLDDALLRPDGTLWILDDGRLSGWRPSARSVRGAPLADDQWFDGPPGDEAAEVTFDGARVRVHAVPEGTLVDELLVAVPQQDAEPALIYQAVRRPDGELWLRAFADGRPRWIAIGGPPRVDGGGP
jgi:hypothetical protein